jgi:hypothetical protein
MNVKIVITIDTEPDNMWDLNLRENLQFKNISELSKLQRVFDTFRARPTYLTTYSVARSNEVSVLKDIVKTSGCEIGAHLHPLETPPFEHHIKGDGSYLHQYSYRTQREKIKILDALLTETFEYKPVSYRGGRWSLDTNTISLLAEYEYLVDTSVTPGISWEKDGGPNFKKCTNENYFIYKDILEVPASIKIKTRIPRIAKHFYLNTPNWTHAEGILRRISNFNIITLDPSFNSYEDMKWACDTLIAERVEHLNIAFHSSVIIAGGSPYTMTDESTKRFFQRLEKLLDYLLRLRSFESVTLKEFYNLRKMTIDSNH